MSHIKKATSPNLYNQSSTSLIFEDDKSHQNAWAFNVEDRLKELSTDEIKQNLIETSNPFSVLFENWVNDFNIASGFRNANAFNAKEIFYIGNKRYDRRGSVGVHNYKEINWLSSFDDVIKLKEKYEFVGVDNVANSKSIYNFNWKPNTLMIFGSEGVGLTDDMIKICDHMVMIPQYGSVRSLNASTASGIVMFDFMSKYQK